MTKDEAREAEYWVALDMAQDVLGDMGRPEDDYSPLIEMFNRTIAWQRDRARCCNCRQYKAKFTVNRCCHDKIHGKDFYPDPDFGCTLFEQIEK